MGGDKPKPLLPENRRWQRNTKSCLRRALQPRMTNTILAQAYLGNVFLIEGEIMDDILWHESVLLELNDRQDVISVSSSREAADLLLNNWPKKRGPSYKLAVMTCLDSFRGKQPPELVRQDLIAAAIEAHIYVKPRSISI
jgi:hypothetical protein